MQGQCKPNAESSLFAEVQPVLAYRRQSYGGFRLIPNNIAFFSPTCSDRSTYGRLLPTGRKNFPIRRQTALTTSKPVA